MAEVSAAFCVLGIFSIPSRCHLRGSLPVETIASQTLAGAGRVQLGVLQARELPSEQAGNQGDLASYQARLHM